MTRSLDADALVALWANDFGVTIRRMARVAMTSPLYDLPGRSSMAFAVGHDVAPGLVDRLDEVITPEELGERMRAPLMRPYLLQPTLFIEGYLMHREQLLLDGGGSFADPELAAADEGQTTKVMRWGARVCRAARTGDELWPGAEVLDWPVLDDAEVAELAGEGAALDPELAGRGRRAMGAVELYLLTVHGEQRDGNFHHGPYPQADGSTIVVQELNDLSNDVLPWVDGEVTLGPDAVGRVARYAPGVQTTFDMFGTMTTEPAEPVSETLAFWLREGDALRRPSIEELEDLGQRAVAATSALYRRIVAWDEDFKTAYGAPLWINHLVPLARLAGAGPEVEEWLLERTRVVAAEALPAIKAQQPRSVWPHVVSGDETTFFPLVRERAPQPSEGR